MARDSDPFSFGPPFFGATAFGAPWSGDVSQWIKTWFQTTGAAQWGLINVFVQKTDKPDVEQAIVNEGASYGRQLGKMADAMDVLIGQLDKDKLRPEQKAAIDDFLVMLEEIRRVKRRTIGSREPPLG